jgi:hypothetical protein
LIFSAAINEVRNSARAFVRRCVTLSGTTSRHIQRPWMQGSVSGQGPCPFPIAVIVISGMYLSPMSPRHGPERSRRVVGVKYEVPIRSVSGRHVNYCSSRRDATPDARFLFVIFPKGSLRDDPDPSKARADSSSTRFLSRLGNIGIERTKMFFSQ